MGAINMTENEKSLIESKLPKFVNNLTKQAIDFCDENFLENEEVKINFLRDAAINFLGNVILKLTNLEKPDAFQKHSEKAIQHLQIWFQEAIRQHTGNNLDNTKETH